MMSYVAFIATVGGIYALLALSLNLVWGSTGLVNLGLAGFFAVGAYASAITTGAGAPVPVGLLAAIAVSIAAGVLVTFATLRLRDDYLAIVTLGFAEVVRLVAVNERWLTNGADGISGIRAPFKQTLGSQGFDHRRFVGVARRVGAQFLQQRVSMHGAVISGSRLWLWR